MADVAPQVVAGALAVLLPAGGAMGFLRKGSVPSLMGGTVVGLLFAWSWYQLAQAHGAPHTPAARQGILTALSVSCLLLVAMGIRVVKAPKKAVPMVLTVVATVAALFFARHL